MITKIIPAKCDHSRAQVALMKSSQIGSKDSPFLYSLPAGTIVNAKAYRWITEVPQFDPEHTEDYFDDNGRPKPLAMLHEFDVISVPPIEWKLGTIASYQHKEFKLPNGLTKHAHFGYIQTDPQNPNSTLYYSDCNFPPWTPNYFERSFSLTQNQAVLIMLSQVPESIVYTPKKRNGGILGPIYHLPSTWQSITMDTYEFQLAHLDLNYVHTRLSDIFTYPPELLPGHIRRYLAHPGKQLPPIQADTANVSKETENNKNSQADNGIITENQAENSKTNKAEDGISLGSNNGDKTSTTVAPTNGDTLTEPSTEMELDKPSQTLSSEIQQTTDNKSSDIDPSMEVDTPTATNKDNVIISNANNKPAIQLDDDNLEQELLHDTQFDPNSPAILAPEEIDRLLNPQPEHKDDK
jgi:hypothetical protein